MDYHNFDYTTHDESSRRKSGSSLLGHLCRIVTATVSILSHTLALLVLICLIALFALIHNLQSLDTDAAAEILTTQTLGNQTKGLEKTPVLYFDLQGSICEHPFSDSQMDSLARLLDERITGKTSHALLDIEAALEYALEDDELKEIVFNLDGLESLSLSSAERICAALDKLKKSPSAKQITVFSTYFSATDYVLAAHADKVILDPLGGVELQGIGISNLYYRDLFDRFKVQPYVFRAGAYKAAVEPYIRTEMSPEVKQELGGIINDLWEHYTDKVKARPALQDLKGPILPDAWTYLEELRQQHGWQAQLDLSRKLVDEVKPLNLLRKEYASRYGTLTDDSLEPKVTDYRDYLKLVKKSQISSSSKVAVVYGLGVIDSSKERPFDFTPANLLPLFEQICLDPEIKAVVVYLNSPGGEVNASEQLRRGLQEVRDHGKKVIISMHDTAASGAYLIASASDYILATPSTLTGSIGVFALSFGFDELLNEYGVKEDGVANHDFAKAYLAQKLPAQLQAIYQTHIEGSYHFFIDTVAKARKLKPEDYQDYAEGRVFLAPKALELGLIDKLGDLNEAIDTACELSGLKRAEVEVMQLIPSETNTFNLLQRTILRGSMQLLPPALVKAELDYFRSLKQISTPQGSALKVMALSPWHTLYGTKR